MGDDPARRQRAQIMAAYDTASADTLPGRMGIKILEASPRAGRGHHAGRRQHAALRPAARRRLVRARRDASARWAPRCTRARTASRSGSRSAPPITGVPPTARSPAWPRFCTAAARVTTLRDRHHRRAGPARLHLPADLPATATRSPATADRRRRFLMAPLRPARRWLLRSRPATRRPGTSPRQGIGWPLRLRRGHLAGPARAVAGAARASLLTVRESIRNAVFAAHTYGLRDV